MAVAWVTMTCGHPHLDLRPVGNIYHRSAGLSVKGKRRLRKGEVHSCPELQQTAETNREDSCSPRVQDINDLHSRNWQYAFWGSDELNDLYRVQAC
ncbi:hypothetical protein J6590_029977 [Homalodisca vitripennis]|nr:hypothetical protein J6590_029977 [Homalodisca vitripennis]